MLFRDILLRLRDGRVTEDDWKYLMKQTPAQVEDLTSFNTALRLHPTVETVVNCNVTSFTPANRQLPPSRLSIQALVLQRLHQMMQVD